MCFVYYEKKYVYCIEIDVGNILFQFLKQTNSFENLLLQSFWNALSSNMIQKGIEETAG